MIFTSIISIIGTGTALGATIGGVLKDAGLVTAKGVVRITLAGACAGLVAGISDAINDGNQIREL